MILCMYLYIYIFIIYKYVQRPRLLKSPQMVGWGMFPSGLIGKVNCPDVNIDIDEGYIIMYLYIYTPKKK